MSKVIPYESLNGLMWLALMTGRASKPFPQPGQVGEFTIGNQRRDPSNVLPDLKSDDIAQRRPDTMSDINLNGKARRGRYSKAIGKT